MAKWALNRKFGWKDDVDGLWLKCPGIEKFPDGPGKKTPGGGGGKYSPEV